ncbi:MAG TPA: tetratricopeptide repeat protein [Verrucomicrobiae bacterium]|jgi:tetratricopeptide (TPR) repeat protein|nr:tetratricopeptide repeat protein [Verrucomicrobiae bacterium]
MKMLLRLNFQLFCVCLVFGGRIFAAGTNSISTNSDAVADGLVQLQAQLHAAQLQIEQGREENSALAQSNSDAMNARIAQLEQAISTQRAGDAETARRTQQLTLYLIGSFGFAGLLILLLMGYFQWRAFSQLAEISAHHAALIEAGEGVHQLAAPGRATVETSNARLLDVVGRLEKRILELEGGGRLLAEPSAKSNDLLADGQKFLDANEPQKALDCFEKFLSAQPQNAEALVKKASALEKLGRADEALAFCDRAISADASLVMAYLHKGGLLNKLARYEESLKCYEQAMLVQDKKSTSKL